MKVKWKNIFLCSGIYLVSSIIIGIVTNEVLSIYLAWNMVLSTFVLLFGYLMNSKKVLELKKIWYLLISVLWLLMFPNAFYFITDLIHLSRYDFYLQVGYLSYYYVEDISLYLMLALIFIGVIISLGYGYFSLRLMKKSFEAKFGVQTKEYLVLFVLFLSSIGIGIGRFLRFNSWDLFRPAILVQSVIDNLSWFFMGFVMIFFAMQVFVYYGFYFLRKAK